MATISIEVDEAVENFLKRKDIPYNAYLWRLIQQDMLLEEIRAADESWYTILESIDDLDK